MSYGGSTVTTPSEWQAFGSGRSIGIVINDVFIGGDLEYQFDFSTVTTMDDVAAVFQDTINTLGNLVTVTFNTNTNKFIFTTVMVGPYASIGVFNADIGNNVHFAAGLVGQFGQGS